MNRTPSLTYWQREELIVWVARMAIWELFATFTFRTRHGQYEAAAAYESFMDRNLPQVSHFYVVEANPSGDGGHHIHALWHGTEDLRRDEVWRRGFHQLGRCRIEPVNTRSQVIGYCVKYVCKEGGLWWFRLNSKELFQRLVAA